MQCWWIGQNIWEFWHELSSLQWMKHGDLDEHMIGLSLYCIIERMDCEDGELSVDCCYAMLKCLLIWMQASECK